MARWQSAYNAAEKYPPFFIGVRLIAIFASDITAWGVLFAHDLTFLSF